MSAVQNISAIGFVACILLGAGPAYAQDLKPICADRPGKGIAVCTVDEGHWQAEMGLWDGNFMHRDGVTTDLTSAGASTLKYGISDNADLEASIAFYQSVRVHDASGSQTISGVGDLFLRAKWNPAAGTGTRFTWLLDSFVKLPTADRDLGNGKVEGGFLLPMAYDLGNGWVLGSTPEVDLLSNAGQGGYHANLVDVLGVSRDLGNGFILCTEIFTVQNLDPLGTVSQYGIGPGLAWQPDPDNQFDGGLAVGLNRATPDLELYVGFSHRF